MPAVCEAQLNALCFKVFIRFGQEKGSWLGCWGEGWRGPTLATTTRLPEYNVGSPHSFKQWGYWTKIQGSFFVVQLVPYKAFFVLNQIALLQCRGGTWVQAQNSGQMLSILTFSLVNTRLAGWSKPLWFESWQAVIQHICGEQLNLEPTKLKKTQKQVMLYCFIGIEVCSFLKELSGTTLRVWFCTKNWSHLIRLTILPQVVHELEDQQGQKENILEEL